jgi:hypothetical protein
LVNWGETKSSIHGEVRSSEGNEAADNT